MAPQLHSTTTSWKSAHLNDSMSRLLDLSPIPTADLATPLAKLGGDSYHRTTIDRSQLRRTPPLIPCSFVGPDPKQLDEKQILPLLEQGFTRGLVKALDETIHTYAVRFWIIDNSGSMQMTDGKRLCPTKRRTNVKMIPCTRWEELVECVEYHIKLAGLAKAPTHFRLLNSPRGGGGAAVGGTRSPQQFSVGVNQQNEPRRRNVHDGQNCSSTSYYPCSVLSEETSSVLQNDVDTATSIIRTVQPEGPTPLTAHILAIRKEIIDMTPMLRRINKKANIVIATDGLPTDELGCGGEMHQKEFVKALRSLQGLPVWIVIRLCTNERDVVKFYNQLDYQLELSLEVLDDFIDEGREIKRVNSWLNYGLPLHRLREMGFHNRIFDMLDERPLSRLEFQKFCIMLFGQEKVDDVAADPMIEWNKFSESIELFLKEEMNQFVSYLFHYY